MGPSEASRWEGVEEVTGQLDGAVAAYHQELLYMIHLTQPK